MREFHYRWEFELESSPEQLWPLVADTNRFNRDTNVPAVEMLARLRHDALVSRDDKRDRVYAVCAGEHVLDETLVARNVYEP